MKPSSLGDIVHTFPAVALLRQTASNAIIDWVAADSLTQTAALCPGGVNCIIEFPRKQLHSLHLSCLKQLWRDLRCTSYDAVIDFQGLLRSGLMTMAAHSPLKLGFANAREGAPWFYTHRISLPQEMLGSHAAEKNVFLMRRAMALLNLPEAAEGIPDAVPTLPDGWRDNAIALMGRCGIGGNGPLVAVGASSRWESKTWPVGFFAATLDAFVQRIPDARIWFLGTAGAEAKRADDIIAHCATETAARLHNLAGKTDITEMTTLLASSQAMLTNDSGPMHIAAALRVPCVALFGSTSHILTGPYGPAGRHTIIRSRCTSSPCFRRQCPKGDGQLCSADVAPSEAAEALAAKIKQPNQ